MILNGFKCTKCKPDVRFQTLSEYHGHMIGNHQLQYVCHFCPFTSSGRSGLLQHESVHNRTSNNSHIPKYQCDICPSDPGAWFSSRNLSQHRKKYH